MENRIKTVVVDDEPLACKRIVKLLEPDEEIELTAVCSNGEEAIQEINNNRPDLVFLDIQMPEIDGFNVLQNIKTDNPPAIIFVTAYDEYALKAFEVHALDYLLKPFKETRFRRALNRAKESIRQEDGSAIHKKVQSLLDSFDSSNKHLSRLMVKSSGRFFFLNVGEIDWIESAGNYVRIHTGGKNYLIRDTMLNMENKLDSDTFFRIHRSAIVNIAKVKELEQWFHGDYMVIMNNGKKLTMSRNYKELLQRFV